MQNFIENSFFALPNRFDKYFTTQYLDEKIILKFDFFCQVFFLKLEKTCVVFTFLPVQKIDLKKIDFLWFFLFLKNFLKEFLLWTKFYFFRNSKNVFKGFLLWTTFAKKSRLLCFEKSRVTSRDPKELKLVISVKFHRFSMVLLRIFHLSLRMALCIPFLVISDHTFGCRSPR